MGFFQIMGMLGKFGVPGVLLLAIIGMRKNEGLWGNALAGFNVTFAALLALNYWEGLASLLAGLYAGGLYYYDYCAVWIVFLFSYAILDEIARRLSRVKVKFAEPIEQAGTVVSGLLLFGAIFLFYSFTLHLAPLGTPFQRGETVPVYDTMRGQSYDLLSSGNLSPFISNNRFNSGVVFKNQNARRAALLTQALDGKGTSFEGSVPGQ